MTSAAARSSGGLSVIQVDVFGLKLCPPTRPPQSGRSTKVVLSKPNSPATHTHTHPGGGGQRLTSLIKHSHSLNILKKKPTTTTYLGNMSLLVLSRNSGSCPVGFSLITRKNFSNLCLQVWAEFRRNCTCSRLRISPCFILPLNCCVHCSSAFC